MKLHEIIVWDNQYQDATTYIGKDLTETIDKAYRTYTTIYDEISASGELDSDNEKRTRREFASEILDNEPLYIQARFYSVEFIYKSHEINI